MRPNTPHYVVTLEHSINAGQHFYCRATLADHAWALLHAGLVGKEKGHRELDSIIRRILDRSIQDYFEVVRGSRSLQGDAWLLSFPSCR
jgi:hypothetical protein